MLSTSYSALSGKKGTRVLCVDLTDTVEAVLLHMSAVCMLSNLLCGSTNPG